MRTVLATTLAMALCTPAHTTEMPTTPTDDGGVTVKITRQQWAECQRGGGCVLMPVQTLSEGIERIRKQCGVAI